MKNFMTKARRFGKSVILNNDTTFSVMIAGSALLMAAITGFTR